MAMGKRKQHANQDSMWVAIQDLPRRAAHPFSVRLNQIFDQRDFDASVEGLCERFYADDGRPGLAPGRYFRLLLIGYFEGVDAERAIAWRAVRRILTRRNRSRRSAQTAMPPRGGRRQGLPQQSGAG